MVDPMAWVKFSQQLAEAAVEGRCDLFKVKLAIRAGKAVMNSQAQIINDACLDVLAKGPRKLT